MRGGSRVTHYTGGVEGRVEESWGRGGGRPATPSWLTLPPNTPACARKAFEFLMPIKVDPQIDRVKMSIFVRLIAKR